MNFPTLYWFRDWQSTWNVFELCWTFCPANYGSLAGHFGILPDISKKENLCRIFLTFRQTFLLYIKALLKCLARCNFFVIHFAQFHLARHFVRREFTPSPDIRNFRRTCPARPADFTYSGLGAFSMIHAYIYMYRNRTLGSTFRVIESLPGLCCLFTLCCLNALLKLTPVSRGGGALPGKVE